MNEPRAIINYGKTPTNTILQITGALRFNQCAPLEHFLKECLPMQKPQSLLVDLSHTVLLDSTALGLLAQIALKIKELTGEKPEIYCQDQDLKTILLSMSLDQLFDFVSNPEIPESLPELINCAEKDDALTTARAFHAHKALMELSEKNKHEFKDVVDLLSESLRKPL
jgi:anti-anti-sigma regulatory factor